MLTSSMAVLVIPTLLLTAAAGPDPGHCAVVDSHGRCLVAALDPGRPGGPEAAVAQRDPVRPRVVPRKGSEPPPPPQPISQSNPIGTGWFLGPANNLNGLVQGIPAPPAAAPIDTGTLARRATSLLTIAPPAMRMSTNGHAYVGLPLWLWIDGGGATAIGPVSATATAGAARVTAVGRLTTVEWSMGPPGAQVRCPGPGTPWTGQAGPSPDCGYTYTLRSLPERTGGTGRWTVTATGVWTVTWTGINAGVPVNGQDTLQLTSQASLPVGEVQVLTGGNR